MAERKFCCFKGRGEISIVNYAALLSRTAGLVPVGNASAFSVNVTENSETVRDYTSATGGTACVSRELESVTVNVTLRCHSPRNWALATNGAYDEEITSAAVASEAHVLWPGALVPLEHLLDDAQTVVVKNPDGDVTYALGTDYTVTAAGSIKHVKGGSIAAPTIVSGRGTPNIHVSYTRRDQRLVQLYSRPSEAVMLHFDGYNVAQSPVQPMHFDLYKVQFGPAATVNLIGDNLAQLELTGTVERDGSRSPGTLVNPFSQYGTLRI